jgi:hypothetical protein
MFIIRILQFLAGNLPWSAIVAREVLELEVLNLLHYSSVAE